MKLIWVIVAGIGFVAAAAEAQPARNDGSNWPTLHGDLQRSGFYPRFPAAKLRLGWRQELYRELTGPRCEVIAGGGLAFMGTYAGRMYAWDLASGAQKWVFQTGGPIGHSPMLADGTLFFGAMDRCLYAVDTQTGREKWRFEAGEGIWTSPVIFHGLVLFGARDGIFYAIDAQSGVRIWTHPTADRILTTASISSDGEKVIFASEDMHLYCLRVADGKLEWKSRKLQGLSVRDYFPVVYPALSVVEGRDLVFITTNPVKDFHTILGENEQMLVQRTLFTGRDKRYIPGGREEVEEEQKMIVEFLGTHPGEQTFYAFRVADGQEPWIAPILYTGGLHNPVTPASYNPATGDIYVQIRSAYGVWDGGGEVRSFTGFGRLRPESGRVELLGHGYRPKEAGRPAGAADTPWGTFNYIGDETQSLSCSPGYLFSNHQGYLGAMALGTGLLANRFGKRDTYGGFYGAGAFGWEDKRALDRAAASGQPLGVVNEWHGPARAIVSVVGSRVLYPTGSQVLCLEGVE